MNLEKIRELTSNLLDRDFMLKKKQAMLEALIESSPIPMMIWITDQNLTFTDHGNLGNLPELGIERYTDFTGTTIYEYFKTEDPNHFPIDQINRALNGEIVTYWLDIENRNIWTKCFPLNDYDGSVVGVVGITWDLTDYNKKDKIV